MMRMAMMRNRARIGIFCAGARPRYPAAFSQPRSPRSADPGVPFHFGHERADVVQVSLGVHEERAGASASFTWKKD